MGHGDSVFRKRIAGIAIAVLVSGATGPDAWSMNRQGLTREDGPAVDKCGPDVYFRFVDTGAHSWTNLEKDRISDAIQAWEDVIDRNGSPVVDLHRAQGSPQIDIKFVTLPAGVPGALGFGSCSDGVLELATSLLGEPQDQKGIAVHEFGHILGLSHVSEDDNLPSGSQIPSMVAGPCTPGGFDLGDLASISQDDRAALTNRQGGGGAAGFQADPSFETVASVNSYFTIVNATFDRENSTSSPVGSYNLHYTGNEPVSGGNDPYVYQEEIAGYAGTVDASAYIRKSQSSDSGTVSIRILTRAVSLSGVNFDPVGGNPDARCILSWAGDWTIRKDKAVTPTTSWVQYDTTTYSISADVVGIRVSVVNELVGCPSGSPVPRRSQGRRCQGA